MPNALFEIGPFTVTLLGVFTALGVIGAMTVIGKEARRYGWETESVHSIILAAFFGGVVGARLYYAAVFAPEYFLSNPARILAFHEGGLSIQGALFGGLIAIVVYTRVKRLSFWKSVDILAPGMILGQAIGRVGCDVFGVEASERVWWAVEVAGRALHPVQLYESMLNYLLFLGLWAGRRYFRRGGEVFFVYLMGFAVNRFGVEFFRVNPSAIGPLTVAHVTSIAMFVGALAILALRRVLIVHAAGTQTEPGSAESDSSPTIPSPARSTVVVVAALMAVSILAYYLIHAG